MRPKIFPSSEPGLPAQKWSRYLGFEWEKYLIARISQYITDLHRCLWNTQMNIILLMTLTFYINVWHIYTQREKTKTWNHTYWILALIILSMDREMRGIWLTFEPNIMNDQNSTKWSLIHLINIRVGQPPPACDYQTIKVEELELLNEGHVTRGFF